MSRKIPQIASYRTITDGDDGDLGKIHWQTGFHGEEHLNPFMQKRVIMYSSEWSYCREAC